MSAHATHAHVLDDPATIAADRHVEILTVVDSFRSAVSPQLDATVRHELGQFLTPGPVAEFMASLFACHPRELRLLDAGAGAGILSAALIRNQIAGSTRPDRIAVTAYEVDPSLVPYLRRTYDLCASQCQAVGIDFTATVLNQDFIEAASRFASADLFSPAPPPFNSAIVNPPYGKIASDSRARLLLRSAGIETSNLYTGFIALIVKLLQNNGELVAITPRSFCNGPYFRPFRQFFLGAMSLRQVHLYESRSTAFGDDDVLQENVIIHAVKSRAKPKTVVISTSSGRAGDTVTRRRRPYTEMVAPTDHQLFIHIPTHKEHAAARHEMARLDTPLHGLGLSVSTGRVVDFRAREFILAEPKPGSWPLIYPCHFNGLFVSWPRTNGRKPNAILDAPGTQELLVPAGVYVLAKRFTTKEEPRRVVACIYDPSRVPAEKVGFENHLNYFHMNGAGLPMEFAKGLWAFLNSTAVDLYLRQFNGHTQVNATDLRSLTYPTRAQLGAIGRRIPDEAPEQETLDALVRKELS